MDLTQNNTLGPKAQLAFSCLLSLFPHLKNLSYDDLLQSLEHAPDYPALIKKHEDHRRQLEQDLAATGPDDVFGLVLDDDDNLVHLEGHSGESVRAYYEARIEHLPDPADQAIADLVGGFGFLEAVGELQAAGIVDMSYDWEHEEYLYSLKPALLDQVYQERGLKPPAPESTSFTERTL